MIAQLDLLDWTPERPRRSTKPIRPGRKSKQAPPPLVVIDSPQLPPAGAFAKINGRWHVWEANDSLSGSCYGWVMCKPYWSRAHLSDTPPTLETGNSQPKGWIKQAKGERTVVVAGREFTCRIDEPDPVVVEVRNIPCVIDFHFGFGTHAIDRDKPFWSESGFRSFDPMVSTAEEAIAIIERYIDEPRNPKGFGMGPGGCGGELVPWREWTHGLGNGRFVEQEDNEH